MHFNGYIENAQCLGLVCLIVLVRALFDREFAGDGLVGDAFLDA